MIVLQLFKDCIYLISGVFPKYLLVEDKNDKFYEFCLGRRGIMYSEYFKVTSPHFGQWCWWAWTKTSNSLSVTLHKIRDFLHMKYWNISAQLQMFQKWGFLQESPIWSCIEREQKKLVVLCCNGIAANTQTHCQCFGMISLQLLLHTQHFVFLCVWFNPMKWFQITTRYVTLWCSRCSRIASRQTRSIEMSQCFRMIS